MTLEEFIPIARKLNETYTGGEPMFKERKQVASWCDELADLDAAVVERAVKAIIAKSKFRPTIADIRAEASRSGVDWNAIQEHRRVQDFKRRAGDGT